MKQATKKIRDKRWWFIRDFWKIVFGMVCMMWAWALIINRIGHDRIIQWIDSLGVWGPVMIVGIRILTSIFPIFTWTPWYIASGYLFGLEDAFIYNSIWNVIWIIVSFFIARRYGLPVVRRIIGQESTEKIIELLDSFNSPKTFAISRSLFFFIDDIRNYAAGMSRIWFRRYFIISLVVTSAWSFYMIYIGFKLAQI